MRIPFLRTQHYEVDEDIMKLVEKYEKALAFYQGFIYVLGPCFLQSEGLFSRYEGGKRWTPALNI